ncbi:response regulator [Flavobacterium sp.]|uniref:response regulator n=1 Tax=Flavobacterium sp. TaxID=239 RepID=UPI001209FC1D|nr:response regulator [Flavobacterium sp.]RZJ70397.1 MAG: response regulator [Flavobacterium sp.]
MIYYLDDDKDDLMIFVDIMVGFNKQVMVFETLDAFRDQLFGESEVPEILFLDFSLNGTTGHDVLKTIRGDKRFDDVPVVIFTSSIDQELAQKSYEFGADRHIVKSTDYFLLEKDLRDIIGLRRTRDLN